MRTVRKRSELTSRVYAVDNVSAEQNAVHDLESRRFDTTVSRRFPRLPAVSFQRFLYGKRHVLQTTCEASASDAH